MDELFDENIADEFKIRASASGRIMGGATSDKLTQKQMSHYEELLLRKSGVGNPITDKMDEQLAEYERKLAEPDQLSSGAETYCREWIQERLYGIKRVISTRAMEKGNLVENENIDYYAEMYGHEFLLKNNERREDEWMTGECDLVVKKKRIVDIKSSWSAETFPLFATTPDVGYVWQGRCYMRLWNIDEFELAYVLANTPMHLIEQEAKAIFYGRKTGESYDEIYRRVLDAGTVDHLPPSLRFKTFLITRDLGLEDKIIERVKLCREFIRKEIQGLNEELQRNPQAKYLF